MSHADLYEPPHGDVIARLLSERYPLAPGEKLTVEVDPKVPVVELALWDSRQRYALKVGHRSGGSGEDPWMLAVDALDALFGQLIDTGRAYRDLPTGLDVEYQGVSFEVEVEHSFPEVERLAEQLLEKHSDG